MTMQKPNQPALPIPNLVDAAASMEAARHTVPAPTIAPALAAAGADQWLNTEERALIAQFWQDAGIALAYPRALDRVVAIALPVVVVRIPRLRPRHADEWLLARGRAPLFGSQSGKSNHDSGTLERRVHGCFVSHKQHGYIFLDGTDPDDEVRFTLAHELAHFMLDHHHPRQRAIAHFGEEIIPVLNEERAPTWSERFRSIRAQLPIGSRVNFMQRDLDGSDALELVDIEDRADRVAFALLAPPFDALAAVLDAPYAEQVAHLHDMLIHKYGLPPQPAARYARGLLGCIGSTPSPWQDLRGYVEQKKSAGAE